MCTVLHPDPDPTHITGVSIFDKYFLENLKLNKKRIYQLSAIFYFTLLSYGTHSPDFTGLRKSEINISPVFIFFWKKVPDLTGSEYTTLVKSSALRIS